MSLDGKPLPMPRSIVNDKPSRKTIPCPCGGSFYASKADGMARCSNGEMRCLTCRRPARKFGRSYTCGIGCVPHA